MFPYPKGSEWHKWDLHVHTPASALQHSLGDDWDIYVEKLIESVEKHKISAIVTGDYFTIAGYRKLLLYYNATTKKLTLRDKSVDLLIIPGVELRLNIFNSEEESINLHLFFDPEFCSPDFIESHFLEELKVDFRGREYPLKDQSLFAIGKSISSGQEVSIGQDFSSTPPLEKSGFRKKALAAVTLHKRDINEALEAIDNIFESQKLPPKAYLIAVVGKGHGGIASLKWFEDNKRTQFTRAGLIREDIIHQADIIFSNSTSDHDFYLGKDPATPEGEVRERFKNLKPCVWGSDSHDLEHLLHPSNGNSFDYTWIKSELSFEGLKQITFEPELRVKIQKDDPCETETYARIEKCVINFPTDLKIQDKESTEAIDFCLRGKYEIKFSNNLTCIIGGRGSGKSTLVHILYNSLMHRDPAKLLELDSPLGDLELTSKDPLGKVRGLIQVDIPLNTEFYLQNEIEKFAKDIQEMSNLVRQRLVRISALDEKEKSLGELNSEFSDASLRLDELISAYDELTNISEKIAQLNKEIGTLKKQTEVIKSEEYASLQDKIEEIANVISNFESYEREYKKVTEELSAIVKNVQKLDWSKYGGQAILRKIQTDLTSYQAELEKAFRVAKLEFERNDYSGGLAAKKAELKKYLKEKGMSPENIGELTDAAQQIASLEGQIQSLRAEALPYEEIYSRKEVILSEYKARYQAYHTRFFAVSAALQNSLAGLKFADQQIEIHFYPRINEQLLKDAVVEYIKKNNISKTILDADSIQAVLFDNEAGIADLVSDKQRILDVVNNSQRATIHTQVLQELLSNNALLEKLYLRMQKYHFGIDNIQVQTKLGEKFLQSTSFGERCGIVISIVLVAGTNPIVIDQPEDNLDGRFVTNVLVPLIRKQKLNRQIILVTRDANIAIGGDAELISILESAGTDRTEVLPATIENKEARSKYIWILDGGERAFQTREEKYNLS